MYRVVGFEGGWKCVDLDYFVNGGEARGVRAIVFGCFVIFSVISVSMFACPYRIIGIGFLVI